MARGGGSVGGGGDTEPNRWVSRTCNVYIDLDSNDTMMVFKQFYRSSLANSHLTIDSTIFSDCIYCLSIVPRECKPHLGETVRQRGGPVRSPYPVDKSGFSFADCKQAQTLFVALL